MVAQETPNHDRGGNPRADFVASLGRRLAVLRAGLREVEAEPRSAARRDMLLRRVHALGAAAGVLGFDEVQAALVSAEDVLRRSGSHGEVSTGDIAEVARAFELVPSLVWGAKLGSESGPEPETPDHAWPLCVLVVGAPSLGEGLSAREEGIAIEHEHAEDPSQAVDIARSIAPDVVVVDADKASSAEAVDELLDDPLIEPFALVVVGSFEKPEAASAFVAKGAARVLPKPVSPDTLRQNVASVGRRSSDALPPREPIGDVTVDELAGRIAAEVRRGLVEAQEAQSRGLSVPFGEGVDVLAAVWGAVARVREIATMRSSGGVRFDASGPEGAIPLAPWTGGERRAGERGTSSRRDDSVSLEGRRVVVVDDDPSVVWFLAGLLRDAGVEVIEAHDGERALEKISGAWPDVVISDVLMPKMDGFSLCRELKRDIAVRDVPVILLSWKEDLLQRVRELGANADGYLRKEATGATVLARVREVLRPRARVESRLDAGGGVRGRLDGLTPRLILELACAKKQNCRVSVRDAVFLYEVEIRDGQPVQATRTASDGNFERGARVIAGLLGVSAGRFVITPNKAPSRDDFKSSLSELLAGPIRRARAAQRLLSGSALMSVEKVDIDEAAVAAYVASTPDPAHSLTQRLIAGESPRDIVLSGDASAEMLELVLADVARHGGVRGVVRDGEPLDLDARPSVIPSGQSEVDVSDAESEPPQFTFALSPEPPQTSARLPLSRQLTPHVASEAQLEVAGFKEESGTFPGVGPAAPVAETEPTRSPPAPTMRAQSPLPVKAVPRPKQESVDEAWGTEADLEEPPASEASWQPERVEIAPDEADEAVIAASDAASEAPEPEAAEEPESDDADEDSALEDSDEDDADEDSDEDDAVEDSADEDDEREEIAALPTMKRIEFPRDLPKAALPPTKDIQAPGSKAKDLLPPTKKIQADDAALPPAKDIPVGDALPPTKKIHADEERPAKKIPADEELPATKSIGFPADTRAETPEPEPIAEERAPRSAKKKKSDGGVLGIARVVLVMGAAGALSFGAVSWLRSMAGNEEKQPAAASSAALPTAAPTASGVAPSGTAASKPKAADSEAKIEDLPLPPGVPLADGKGLLEIDISGKDAIYVDGTFVGRGPLRRVPLDPGKHDVKLRQPGEERTFQVDVKKASRTRLSLEGEK